MRFGLIKDIRGSNILGDKDFDSDEFINQPISQNYKPIVILSLTSIEKFNLMSSAIYVKKGTYWNSFLRFIELIECYLTQSEIIM